MRRSFVGWALIFAFVFGAGGGNHQGLLNTGEAAEEDAGSEERDEELLRSRAASSRSRPRKKNNQQISRALSVPARLLALGAPLYSQPVLTPVPVYRYRPPFLQVFRI